jgi:sec-independent protein translocase protein TatA
MLEVVIILAIVFLLFGWHKLPEIMKAFGQGLREFRRNMRHPP